MLQQTLTILFYLLFAITPLLWAPWNFELFEYNKMSFVYALTIIITAGWLIKMVHSKTLLIKRTPLDIPLLLFLLANILSTVFSLDRHISIWGYYSRSNGGLFSIISYILLYYALVSNFTARDALKFLKATLLGGVIVALYAIPEHFGISPSCVILNGSLTSACWVQDVEARVFATFGQPNWLAAYLAMLIFPTFYFLLKSTSRPSLIINSVFIILFYLAFTFTYSRGATLGLLAGLASLVVAWGFPWLHLPNFNREFQLNNIRTKSTYPFKSLTLILSVFIFINILFGSALTDFKLLSKFAAPARPALTVPMEKPSSGTQLETGGTESGKIRLIVWQGAWEIFKHYPVFGSGVETFAQVYYNFRPATHNLVSEWDFLYNKAHNEYLNYLSTTGIIGFTSYLAVIMTFLVWSIRNIVYREQKSSPYTKYHILCLGLLAGYVSYLVQNFFGFSVVVTALFFFLFPALIFLFTNTTSNFIPPNFLKPKFFNSFFRRPIFSLISILIIIIAAAFFFITLARYYFADTLFAEGLRAQEAGSIGKAYTKLSQAVALNPGEPYYQSELALTTASVAVSFKDSDASLSAQLKDQAQQQTEKILSNYPHNVSYLRTAVRSFYTLSLMDQKYLERTLQTLDSSITLAPTDPKLYFNKALVLGQAGKSQESIQILEKTIQLKANYREAYLALANAYFEQGKKDEAIATLQKVLQFIPGDIEVLEKLKEWK